MLHGGGNCDFGIRNAVILAKNRYSFFFFEAWYTMDTTVLGHNTTRNMQDDSVFRGKQIICTLYSIYCKFYYC